MIEQFCDGCMRPRPAESFICRDCADQWHTDLHSVEHWLKELQVEVAKQSRKGSGRPRVSRSAEQALPVNVAASEASDAIRFHLVVAVKVLNLGQPDGLPSDDIGSILDWLLQHEDSMPFREESGYLIGELRSLLQRAQRLCDRKPERVYIGTCGCGSPLMSDIDRETVRCQHCKTVVNVEESREALKASIHDKFLTIKQIAELTGTPYNTVWHWVDRDQIAPHPDNRLLAGPGRYRLGDAIERIETRRARHAS